MVKILSRALSYNWKYYAAAVAVFVAFWQMFSIFSSTRVADDKLLTAMRQNADYFEKAFLEGDVFETQRIMWRIKNDNIKRITFHPVAFEGSKWIFKEAIVGNLYDRPRAQLNRNVPFISNGAELGRLEYVIDLVDVNSAVFGENYVLFITVVFFFMGLLVLSNVGAIKTIFSIERCVDETNALATAGEHSKIQDSIQRSIQSLPESLRATPFAVLIGRLADVLHKASRLESELAVSKATSDLAAQVAHDIRSPLAALGAAAKGLEMPEDQRKLVEGAVGRMQGIADDLLQRYRAPSATHAEPKPAVCALGGLIEQVLSEKRLQHKDKTGVKIEFNGASGEIKALVEPKELQRLLSNLVNNSVEAFDKNGTVAVSLSGVDGKVLIEVKDNGKGIPADILSKLGQKGETHGKTGGNGLGLYHARTTVEAWGGSFKIKSEPGKGTAVLIELPRPAAPVGRMVVLLDDDMLVHMNWKLAAKAAGVELKAYKTKEDFAAGIESLSKDVPIYIDSDLGNNVKGEDIAKELNNKGFTNLTMATGHGADKFSHLPWLKVTGKEPPWG
ncbi:MAG: HAMP domain-containing sensor histidine kinase [Elusimicrobiales bacterium]|nr:HAMP domain-containing sensor histidine kinase [Elusimicrobiales bacterium]